MKMKSGRDRLAAQIARLAFAKTNDAVSLITHPERDPDALNLQMLESVKRGKDGSIEVKLMDREPLIRLLVELLRPGDGEADRAKELYSALNRASESIGGGGA